MRHTTRFHRPSFYLNHVATDFSRISSIPIRPEHTDICRHPTCMVALLVAPQGLRKNICRTLRADAS